MNTSITPRGLKRCAILATESSLRLVDTLWHGVPARGLLAPVITEGSSFITSLLFFWIIWLAWCVAPPTVRPRWKLLVHGPAAILYSLFHVLGFVLLRKLAFDLAVTSYEFAGNTVREFLYEFSKDTGGYVLFLGAFTLVNRLLNPTRRRTADRER